MDNKIRNIVGSIAVGIIIIVLLATATGLNNRYIALIIIILLMAGRGIFATYQFEKTTDMIIKEKEKALEIIKNPSDESWEYRGLSERVENCFYKVNEALEKNEIDIAKDYVTRKSYENLEERGRAVSRDNRFKIEKIQIVRTLPIKAIDKIGEHKDLIKIAIEYFIEYREGEETKNKLTYEEVWTFVKGHGQWIVSDITEYNSGISINKLEKI